MIRNVDGLWLRKIVYTGRDIRLKKRLHSAARRQRWIVILRNESETQPKRFSDADS